VTEELGQIIANQLFLNERNPHWSAPFKWAEYGHHQNYYSKAFWLLIRVCCEHFTILAYFTVNWSDSALIKEARCPLPLISLHVSCHTPRTEWKYDAESETESHNLDFDSAKSLICWQINLNNFEKSTKTSIYSDLNSLHDYENS